MIEPRKPIQYCRVCVDYEVVKMDGRGFPPDIARRKLEKRCAAKGCDHDIVYRAGFQVSVDKRGF